ncbi:MAG: 4-hydroxy-tetrahydrodipicolinate synthase [Bacteroidota bacterium]|nr:4-hydroxy-tetrahydrodipicolinate synthase [Bacteroidota bacterium]
MITTTFSGTGVALVTPFDAQGSIDFDALKNIIDHVIEGGVNFLVVMGTTGEAAVLTHSEKEELISRVKKYAGNRVPIVVGIGGNNTKLLTNEIENTDLDGISGILSVSPYYNKPTQKGLYNHYKAISEVSPIPIILYNVPGRTAGNINAETVLQLANDFSNITAVKEASGDMSQIMRIIKNKPEGFQVISGDDAITLPLISIGVEGVISVTANALPNQFSNMVNFALAGEFAKAKKEHYNFIEFTEALFNDGNPGGIKAALEILDLCKQHMRNPLAPVTNYTYMKIKENLKKVI